MRTKLLLLTVVAALASAGAALAGNGNGNGNGNGRAHALYVFVGKLTATPDDGDISITVVGGNRIALRAMLGQSVQQSFQYGDTTEFLKWARGVPTVVHHDDLAAGDYVRVNVRAPRGSSLSDVEQVPAGLVGDHGTQLYVPTQPLFLFRGTLTSVGSSGGVMLVVRGGNARAMRLMLGQQASQTFATGGQTIFLLWQGEVPTVISLGQLKVGDRVVVRVRAPRGSTLQQVESTAAVHVGDREPPSNS